MPKFLDDVTCYDSSGNTVSLASLSRAVLAPTFSYPVKGVLYTYQGTTSWSVVPTVLRLFSISYQSTFEIRMNMLFASDSLTLTTSQTPSWLKEKGYISNTKFYPATGYINEQWVEAGPTLKNRSGTIIGIYSSDGQNYNFVYTHSDVKYDSHETYGVNNVDYGTLTTFPFF